MKLPTLKLIIQGSNKKVLSFLLSAILIGMVCSQIDLSSLLHTVKEVHFSTVVYMLLIYFLGQLISAGKWKILLDNAALDRSLLRTTKAYFFGMFVNAFGLGTVGGDIARAAVLKPLKSERSTALASVVADRLHGLIVLLAIGAVGLAFTIPEALNQWFVFGSIAAVVMLGTTWFMIPTLASKLIPIGSKFYTPLASASKVFLSDPLTLFKVTIASILFHFTQIGMFALIIADMQLAISFGLLIATVPFINVATSFPLSVNGIGIREVMIVIFFTQADVSGEQALTIGAMWLIITMLIGALGAVFTAPSLFDQSASKQVT
ncbi:MAG: YbhN family protein [Pseudomonadales bacterium]